MRKEAQRFSPKDDARPDMDTKPGNYEFGLIKVEDWKKSMKHLNKYSKFAMYYLIMTKS